MGSRRDVVIAVPARDEAARLPACLDAIRLAVDAARSLDLIGTVVVAVAAHCCCAATVEMASTSLATTASGPGRHQLSGVVWVYDHAAQVGEVRTQLVLEALHATGVSPDHAWLFSTDADTRVPPSWIIDGLQLADTTGADLITGMVDLDPAGLDPAVIELHDHLIGTGMHPDGTHDHAYAANLMIKMDTFLQLGGFPAVDHGEEHALLAAARSAGCCCLSNSAWRVITSGRTVGRASRGLATVLNDLQHHVDDDDAFTTTTQRGDESAMGTSSGGLEGAGAGTSSS